LLNPPLDATRFIRAAILPRGSRKDNAKV
jgi:hypothetical protein